VERKGQPVKVIGALLVIAFVVLVMYGLFRLGQLIVRAIQRRGPWKMVEDSDGEQVVIRAERPEHEPLLIGAVPFGAMDFDGRLYELRAQGQEKVYALNQGGSE
jgi:hypothetical protein